MIRAYWMLVILTLTLLFLVNSTTSNYSDLFNIPKCYFTRCLNLNGFCSISNLLCVCDLLVLLWLSLWLLLSCFYICFRVDHLCTTTPSYFTTNYLLLGLFNFSVRQSRYQTLRSIGIVFSLIWYPGYRVSAFKLGSSSLTFIFLKGFAVSIPFWLGRWVLIAPRIVLMSNSTEDCNLFHWLFLREKKALHYRIGLGITASLTSYGHWRQLHLLLKLDSKLELAEFLL